MVVRAKHTVVSYPTKKRVKSKGTRKSNIITKTSNTTTAVGLNIRQSITASIVAANPVLNQSSSIRSSVKGPNFFSIQNRPSAVPRSRDYLCQTVT